MIGGGRPLFMQPLVPPFHPFHPLHTSLILPSSQEEDLEMGARRVFAFALDMLLCSRLVRSKHPVHGRDPTWL